MKKLTFLSFFIGILLFAHGQQSLSKYVDPFIGTGFHGHTFPGAIVPFGAIQPSPDTRLTGWDGCSAYHYSDSVIYGFSHTHLSGTGCSDYGDILIMPFTGTPSIKNHEYSSKFSHENEAAEPGYYSVLLDKNDILAELTTTERVAFHRYTFPKGVKSKGIIIDLQHRDEVISSSLKNINGMEFVGHRTSKAWNPNQYVAFSLLSSKEIDKVQYYVDDKLVEGKIDSIEGKNCKAVLFFKSNVKQVVLRVAISAVDIDGARNNQKDVSLPSFELAKQNAYNLWEDALSKIKVESINIEEKKNFYTALYHCFTSPYLYSDRDGRYRGMDQKIHQVDAGRKIYTVFSLWDTYRALHPLLTLIDRQRTADFIYSFTKHYEQGGMLPMWELSAHETWCMIGYHAASVILDAHMKGIKKYNHGLMLQAMIESATLKKLGRSDFAAHGYIPANMEHESVSKTLEYAYDDWCIAQYAKAIGKKKVYEEYIERSQYYKNIVDPNGFMRAKINGGFVTPFDPAEVNNHYTEANAWQYTTYVPHDMENYIKMIGGDRVFEALLDTLFTTSSKTTGRKQVDITGMLGQYAHGNEPSHHAAYLYNYVGKPWKTQKVVRKIMKDFYAPKPDGLCGNEDCGQMSAWYVFSALGFYPVCPGDNQYVVGSPLFTRATIQLENGKKIDIHAYNQGGDNECISLASLNQKTMTQSFFSFDDIKDGALLEFSMNKIGNKRWGKSYAERPRAQVTPSITTVPYFSTDKKSFSDPITVSIHLYEPASPLKNTDYIYPYDIDKIYYTTDGSEPTTESTPYTIPINVNKSMTIKAVAHNHVTGYSKVVTAEYIKYEKDKEITIHSKADKQYFSGGKDGLIDNIRGEKNYRLGGWHGYQNQDFEATVDLLSDREIHEVTVGFLEEIRSWIWFPKRLVVEVSSDNINFRPYGIYENKNPDNDYTEKTEDFTVRKGNPTTARYIRVKAENYGTIPEWHPGSGHPAFIFVDEIIVK